MNTLNNKTINYLTNKYAGEDATVNIAELIADITARLNNPKRNVNTAVAGYLTGTKEFDARVAFYNEVVMNTTRKLRNYRLNDELLIPTWAKPDSRIRFVDGKETYADIRTINFDEDPLTRDDIIRFVYPEPATKKVFRTDSLVPVLKQNYKNIPVAFLWNDPIAIAQHVRKLDRLQTREINTSDKKALAEQLVSLHKELERVTAVLENTNKFDAKLDKREEAAAKRKKRKAAKAAALKEQAGENQGS